MTGLRKLLFRTTNILGKGSTTKQYCRLRQDIQVGSIENVILANFQRRFMTVTKGRIWLTYSTTFLNDSAYAACYFFLLSLYVS